MTLTPPQPEPQPWWDEVVRADLHEVFLLRRFRSLIPEQLKPFLQFHYRPDTQDIMAIWEQPNLANLDEKVRAEARLKLEVIVAHGDTYKAVIESLCRQLAREALSIMVQSATAQLLGMPGPSIKFRNTPTWGGR